MRINHLGGVPKDSVTGRQINNNFHIHCSVVACSVLGHSRMYTIQVHPSWKLQVDWIPSSLTGGMGALGGGGHIIPHGQCRVVFHSTPASFVWHIGHKCTLDGSVRTACTQHFFCRVQLGIMNTYWMFPRLINLLTRQSLYVSENFALNCIE